MEGFSQSLVEVFRLILMLALRVRLLRRCRIMAVVKSITVDGEEESVLTLIPLLLLHHRTWSGLCRFQDGYICGLQFTLMVPFALKQTITLARYILPHQLHDHLL
jgi:hypothetical protein